MRGPKLGPALFALLLLVISTIAGMRPAAAQLADFQKGLISTAPISFDFGNGFSGTVVFTGTTAALSGLYNPTTNGTTLTSNYVLIAPGSVAQFFFSVPVSNLDLRVGTGSGGGRTDTYGLDLASSVQTQAVGASGASIKNQSFTNAAGIYGFNVSSSSANPLRVSVQGTSTPVPAPLSPVGATLLGNLVAAGALIVFQFRRRRRISFAAV